jgi:hypothetical protein
LQPVEKIGFPNRKPGNAAQQVKSPLEVIESFKEQVQDGRALEISGTNSTYQFLERPKRLIDEEYWLLYSNQTLRTSIGESSGAN